MKSVCLVNGSLRGRKSASLAFLRDIDRRLPSSEFAKTTVTVSAARTNPYPGAVLERMATADILVLSFPLYAYGLPGGLMRLLEEFDRYVRQGSSPKNGARVYVIVNCAFPRPRITGEAVRVVKNLCRRHALQWRFAVCIGSGITVALTKRVPLLDFVPRRALNEMVSDVRSGAVSPHEDIFVRPVIPEQIILAIKNHYEKKGEMYATDQSRGARSSGAGG